MLPLSNLQAGICAKGWRGFLAHLVVEIFSQGWTNSMYHRVVRLCLFAFPCMGLLGLLVLSRGVTSSPTSQPYDAPPELLSIQPLSDARSPTMSEPVGEPTPADQNVKYRTAALSLDAPSLVAPKLERLPPIRVERLPSDDTDAGNHTEPAKSSDVAFESARQPNLALPDPPTISSMQAEISAPVGRAIDSVVPMPVKNVMTEQQDLFDLDTSSDPLPETEGLGETPIDELVSNTAAQETKFAAAVEASTEPTPAFSNASEPPVAADSYDAVDPYDVDSQLNLETKADDEDVQTLVNQGLPEEAKFSSVLSSKGEANDTPEWSAQQPKIAPDKPTRVEQAATPTWSPLDIREVELETAEFPEKSPEVVQRIVVPEARRQALKAVTLGFEMIQRGAPYSARSRFVEALQVVARALDDAEGVTSHRDSLRKALVAYEEAADFFPKSTRPDQDVDLGFVAGGHTSDVLRDADVESMTASHCVREYLAFAEQAFGKALGDEELGSRALYGLGRLELSPNQSKADATQVRAYRAMALYQAALDVNPRNYAAANELGVLLTKYGKTEAAIAALQQSTAYAPHPTVWRNLAHLHMKLGQTDLAQQASVRAAQATAMPMPYAVANPKIEWVAPEQFARTRTEIGNPMQVAQQPAAAPAPVQPQKKQTSKVRSARRIWPFGWSQTK